MNFNDLIFYVNTVWTAVTDRGIVPTKEEVVPRITKLADDLINVLCENQAVFLSKEYQELVVNINAHFLDLVKQTAAGQITTNDMMKGMLSDYAPESEYYDAGVALGLTVNYFEVMYALTDEFMKTLLSQPTADAATTMLLTMSEILIDKMEKAGEEGLFKDLVPDVQEVA